VHYTDIEKKAVATCLRFATSNTIRKQFYDYLLPNGYLERVGRGMYMITKKGEKLLENPGLELARSIMVPLELRAHYACMHLIGAERNNYGR